MAGVLAVAHRAGNSLTGLRAALDAGVDLVEADVHRFRARLEIRHWKSFGPRLLWERGEVARRRDLTVPDLAEVLDAAGPAAGRLMLDLKGVHPGLAPAVARLLREAAPGVAVTVCTQHWWMLRAFRGDPHVRVVLSAGSRAGLARLRSRVARGPRPAAACVDRRLLTAAVVAELRRSVPAVFTWPVDEPGELVDARRLGVDGVIGKNLPLLRQVVEAR